MRTFLDHFRRALSIEESEPLTEGTLLRDIPELDSMGRLLVSSAVDEAYGVSLTAEDWRASQTVGELFAQVQVKLRERNQP